MGKTKPRVRRRFTPEFKAEAVRLVRTAGQSRRQAGGAGSGSDGDRRGGAGCGARMWTVGQGPVAALTPANVRSSARLRRG